MELQLNYQVPIESKSNLDGEFYIEGIAINETTTSNGHKFLGEELKSSAKTLINVPLLKDHNNSVDSIVGKVKAAHFNDMARNISFKALVDDSTLQSKIKKGLINSVSVGAHVNPDDIEEAEDGTIIPHKITFKELSIVAVPADSGATFNVVLNNAYKSLKEKETEKTVEIESNLNSNENQNSFERGKTSMEEQTSENSESNLFKELSEKILSELGEMKERLTKLESSDEDEVAVESEPEAEAEVESEEEESTDVEEKGYVITLKNNAFISKRKSYVY